MDQNLYVKLAALTRFFDSKQRLTKRRKMLDKEIGKLERDYETKKHGEEFDILKARIGGIILSGVGVIWLLVLIGALSEEDWSGGTAGQIAGLILPVSGFVLVFLIMIIFGLRRIMSARKRNRNFEDYCTKLWQEEYLPQCNTMRKEMNDIEAEIKRMHKDFDELLTFLPKKYQNLQATSFLLMAVKDGRADTLKEAYNLYEEQLHRWKLEDAACQAAELQRMVAAAMDDLNSQQAETNAHLSAIEQMEYFNYLHGNQ